MATEYRTVDTSSVAGIRTAERLQRAGWTMYSVGLFLVKFYRRSPTSPLRRFALNLPQED